MNKNALLLLTGVKLDKAEFAGSIPVQTTE